MSYIKQKYLKKSPSQLLPPFSEDEEEIVEVLENEQALYLNLSLQSIDAQSEEYFADCLSSLFKRVESLMIEKDSRSLYLDLQTSVVRYRYWNLLVKYLNENISILSSIDYLNFTGSSFNLMQLKDCYQLFQLCQAKKIIFPKILLEETTAYQQFSRINKINEGGETCRGLHSSMKEYMEETNEESPPNEDLNESLRDIWMEEFLESITKNGAVDEEFLQQLGSFSEYWKEGQFILE